MKNLREGFVKTRLAKDIGSKKALKAYERLIEITRNRSLNLQVDIFVFYSDFISFSDVWQDTGAFKKIQEGNGLGERMANAFASVVPTYAKTIIIGTDCPDISQGILQKAIDQLNFFDYIIGPANDGGFYLLASRKFNSAVFDNIKWSTKDVLISTINNIVSLGASYSLLDELIDIDTIEDVNQVKFIIDF